MKDDSRSFKVGTIYEVEKAEDYEGCYIGIKGVIGFWCSNGFEKVEED